jgi:glycerophosphoryl diester phosphodiesterase
MVVLVQHGDATLLAPGAAPGFPATGAGRCGPGSGPARHLACDDNHAAPAEVLETDVHLTRDGVIVTSHDERIDRLSNGHGLIKEMTLAELRQYDFGYGFTPDGGKSYPYRGKGVTIPTLEEVFMAFPGVRVNIEIKQLDPPMAEELWELVQKHQMADQVLINSFASAPTKDWLTLTGDRTAVGADRADMFRFAAYWLPHLDWRAHRLGVKVHYWTINDEPTMRRLIDLGADGIITDYPDRAVNVLREMGRRKAGTPGVPAF